MEEAAEGLIWFASIDGTHCPTNELAPFDTKNSSHKFGGKCALAYELAVLLHKSKLAAVNGPFQSGDNDLTNFRAKLMEETPDGKKYIGDDGYCGEPQYISTRNELDPREVAVFKERVMSRHETFNQKIKTYACLTKKFRTGKLKHKTAFEAVCVLVSYDLECGALTLFDPYL